jgi:exonuclease VII small subunit
MKAEEKEQFKRAIVIAKQTRDELLKARKRIEYEVTRQNKAIAAFSALLGEEAESDLGITDVTLLIIRTAKAPLTALEIRDELRKNGWPIDEYSNAMASLHQVLKRLEDRGEIVSLQSSDGRKRFHAGKL